MKNLLHLVFLLFAAGEPSWAQSKATAPTIVQGDANACELNAAMFDTLANMLRENDERLFVVARLGKGEISRVLNLRRLHNVRVYFKKAEAWNITANRFVFAEGDRVEGEGRIEFYIGSKLMLISLARRNGDICVDCCDFPYPDYYGFGKREKTKKRRR